MFKTPREKKMLLLFICICLGVQLIGWAFTHHSVNTWYPTLNKPSWTPPVWVFGIVWTLLFLLMAASVWLIWKTKPEAKWWSTPYLLFGLQLLLNLLWSALFFGLQSPFLGLIDGVLLWFLLLATVVTFSNINWIAGLLLVPYLGWVTFAIVLNLVIWWQNLL